MAWYVGLFGPVSFQLVAALFWLFPAWVNDLLFGPRFGGLCHWIGVICMCAASSVSEDRVTGKGIWVVVNFGVCFAMWMGLAAVF